MRLSFLLSRSAFSNSSADSRANRTWLTILRATSLIGRFSTTCLETSTSDPIKYHEINLTFVKSLISTCNMISIFSQLSKIQISTSFKCMTNCSQWEIKSLELCITLIATIAIIALKISLFDGHQVLALLLRIAWILIE